ncbi:Glyoxalase domain-containing protein 4, partial [Halocaridina rubra]
MRSLRKVARQHAMGSPYDGKWSKTMIGYGPEDNHFVCELTYNYGVSHYEQGNDFLGMYIECSEAIERAKKIGYPVKEEGEHCLLEAPGGYKFYIINKNMPNDRDPVQHIVLGSSDIERSVKYWRDLAGLTLYNRGETKATLGFAENQAKLVLQSTGGPVEHAKAFGRIAFAAPGADLPSIEKKMKEANEKILTPYVSLDTPGKATVQVVILADPDGHEICFVGTEGFRELSQIDPKGDVLLNEAMEKDKSDEWFSSKGGKASA